MVRTRDGKLAFVTVATLALGASVGCTTMLETRGTVRHSYDEFKQTEKTVLEHMWIKGGFGFLVGVNLVTVDGADMAMLWTKTFSDSGWRYLKCPQLDILADGEPVQTSQAEHDGDVHSSGIDEYLEVMMPRQEVVRMASAQSVKLRLCRDVIELRPENIAAMREFVRVAWGERVAASAAAGGAGSAGASRASSGEENRDGSEDVQEGDSGLGSDMSF